MMMTNSNIDLLILESTHLLLDKKFVPPHCPKNKLKKRRDQSPIPRKKQKEHLPPSSISTQ
jgi:hypothetical protein